MFVNCPSCRGLVATDPATDQPPERCPRCAAPLRDAATVDAVADARSGVAAALAEAFGAAAPDAVPAATDPALDPAARPAISIARLLQADPDAVIEPEAGVPEPAPQPAPEPVPPPAPEPVSPPLPEPRPPTPSTAVPPAPLAAPPAPVAGIADAVPVVPVAPAGRPAPSFARRRRAGTVAAATGRRWPMPALIAGLALLLGMQWLLSDRARLAADAAWRPALERMCALLHCSLPPWREPTAFILLERDVRPHPAAEGALRITASFRNDAARAQPWPVVVLTLSDIDGRPLGARAFSAEEYLGDAPPSPLLDSGQGAVIRMDVVEPGPGAVGFAFDFR